MASLDSDAPRTPRPAEGEGPMAEEKSTVRKLLPILAIIAAVLLILSFM
jgi:hypothetical protein